MRRFLGIIAVGAVIAAMIAAPGAQAASHTYTHHKVKAANDENGGRPTCDENAITCTEVANNIGPNGYYTGHDEPSALFYSQTAGSGNNQTYQLILPKDPPTLPHQDGTGGTWNFQLHPAFWFGMAMCDTQSDPNYQNVNGAGGVACTPDSDTNIFDNTSDPNAADYIGKHPGVAFMEMQFYPPGWAPWPAGNSCDATKWCAALNIDSLSDNGATGQPNNNDCLAKVGIEPVNFAFLTTSGDNSGTNQLAGPLDTGSTSHFVVDPAHDFFMNSGDHLVVHMFDTANGLEVDVSDLTTATSGGMTASADNGFAQVVFDPNAAQCSQNAYDFHPMYSTSGVHTRVTWAAHTYNVAFSDEIGHFEYCGATAGGGAPCTSAGANDPGGVDADDVGCFSPADSTLVQVAGCLGSDFDFDGAPYLKDWPGSISHKARDRRLHPTPIRFTSPTFNAGSQYDQVAFETDLPRIERTGLSPTNNCDKLTGTGCVNPPNGPNGPVPLYPFFTTANLLTGCWWQEGGNHIQPTANHFGGSSATEFGTVPLQVHYEGFDRYNDFRRILSSNPCPQTPAS